ncbi:MAG TPA: hypothetical protein VE776_11365, partial [Actinomycetota bacterium]|nr:hypothetical protein [Actinomycetota bacterium]
VADPPGGDGAVHADQPGGQGDDDGGDQRGLGKVAQATAAGALPRRWRLDGRGSAGLLVLVPPR